MSICFCKTVDWRNCILNLFEAGNITKSLVIGNLRLIMSRIRIYAEFNYFMTEAVTYLLCKSMDWFLYDNGLRHERAKGSVYPWKPILYALVTLFIILFRNLLCFEKLRKTYFIPFFNAIKLSRLVTTKTKSNFAILLNLYNFCVH